MTSHLSTGIDIFSKEFNHNHHKSTGSGFQELIQYPLSTGESFSGFHSYQGSPTTSHLAAQGISKVVSSQLYLGNPEQYHWRNSRFSVAPVTWLPGRHWEVERFSVSGVRA